MTQASNLEWTGPHHSWDKLKVWDYYFKEICPQLEALEKKGTPYYPSRATIFDAFQLGIDQVKVIIVGQEPYDNKEYSNGLAFSTLPHVNPIPRTLSVLFEEYQADLGFDKPRTGDLRGWRSAGVLLLNAALTVEPSTRLAHIKLWERFTYGILRRLSEIKTPVVWMLWGRHAEQYSALVPPHHLKLVAGHPSSANAKLFRGCRHFSKACEFLNQPKEFWRLP